MEFLKNKQNGVYILTPVVKDFEDLYIKVRDKENRVIEEAILKVLPIVPDDFPHAKQWKMRGNSANRFINSSYLKKANNILDIGCGNGWFSNMMAVNGMAKVFSLDVNIFELEQGANAFASENLHFLYADVFRAELPEKYFDQIVINSVIQYFPDLPQLFERLFDLLSEGGSIHIIDSPFYEKNEVAAAAERSKAYYASLDCEAMAENYHHHSWESINAFRPKTLYNPKSKKWLNKLIKKEDSPFYWLQIFAS